MAFRVTLQPNGHGFEGCVDETPRETAKRDFCAGSLPVEKCIADAFAAAPP